MKRVHTVRKTNDRPLSDTRRWFAQASIVPSELPNTLHITLNLANGSAIDQVGEYTVFVQVQEKLLYRMTFSLKAKVENQVDRVPITLLIESLTTTTSTTMSTTASTTTSTIAKEPTVTKIVLENALEHLEVDDIPADGLPLSSEPAFLVHVSGEVIFDQRFPTLSTTALPPSRLHRSPPIARRRWPGTLPKKSAERTSEGLAARCEQSETSGKDFPGKNAGNNEPRTLFSRFNLSPRRRTEIKSCPQSSK